MENNKRSNKAGSELAKEVLDYAKRDLEGRGVFIGMTILALGPDHFFTIRSSVEPADRDYEFNVLAKIFERIGITNFSLGFSGKIGEEPSVPGQIVVAEGSQGSPALVSQHNAKWDSDKSKIVRFELVVQDELDLDSTLNLFRRSPISFDEAMDHMCRCLQDEGCYILLGFEDLIQQWKATFEKTSRYMS